MHLTGRFVRFDHDVMRMAVVIANLGAHRGADGAILILGTGSIAQLRINGTDVAIASAGVILASDDPRSVLSVIELSRASYRKMKQNLWWAAGYNLISVPLAAGVLAPIGFVLPMSIGAILMSASTVVVALNAQLLRRLDLRPETSTGTFLNRTVPNHSTSADRGTTEIRKDTVSP